VPFFAWLCADFCFSGAGHPNILEAARLRSIITAELNLTAMTPSRWRQIEDLYHSARERRPSEQGAFLAEACSSDEELKRTVESLLAQDGSGDQILDRPAVEFLAESTETQFIPGAQLGPYKIEALIGAGGMGKVWKAHDTRLNRTVAIKISETQFSARFEREARAVAALNHPHVCQIYDVHANYLVLEYVEGLPLKGPLALEKTVQYASQILDALDHAHRKLIIHRDLKPGNILVTKKGIKLLDFGIARMSDEPALTQVGAIVGTPAYMAPEQRVGNEATARTDIYAFGCVLYEMVTGQRVPKERMRLEPASLERVVSTCLAEDPEDRWQSAREVKLALEMVGQSPGAPARTPAPEPTDSGLLRWAATTALALLAIGLAFVYFREAPPATRTLRYTVAAPENSTVHSLAISPDGRYVTIAAAVNGKRQLWLRALDSLQAQPLPFTEDAIYPFWSPDSRFIGFFARGKLQKIAASGGPAQLLCDAVDGRGGSWSREDVIVFSPSGNSGVAIQRVPAAGGIPVNVTKTTGNFKHPEFLPGGRHFLYLVSESAEQNGVYLSSLDGKDNRRVLPDVSSVVFAPSASGSRAGYLLFIRDNTLMAQPFSSRKALPFGAGGPQVSGEAFPVAEGVSLTTNLTYAPVTVSENGALLYQSTDAIGSNQILWMDRAGKPLGEVGSPGAVGEPSISPDEKTIAFRKNNATGSDIWLRDLDRGTDRRFTSDTSYNLAPFWSPKGDRIVFSSNQARQSNLDREYKEFNLYQKAASGSGQHELLLFTRWAKYPSQWSRDGRFVVYSEFDPKTKWDLWVLPVGEGAVGDAKPVALLHTEFDELYGQLSPDGQWMAYTSDVSGRREVYVTSFPSGGGERRISTAGGEQPRWRGDGKELFFETANGKMTAVDVKASAGPQRSFEAGDPRPLFDAHLPTGRGPTSFEYDVTADGNRFLVATRTAAASNPLLTLVMNWTAGSKK
jgi:eukaryotic-like serine/threonine-protein kinase